MGDIDRRLKGALEHWAVLGWQGVYGGKGKDPETVKEDGDLEEPPPAWDGQDQQDDWGEHGTGRTGTGGLGYLGVRHPTAYQHTVPPDMQTPCTHCPRTHAVPITLSPSPFSLGTEQGPWLEEGGKVRGAICPGPVCPLAGPLLPAPCPGFTLRCGRLHLGSQPAGPPLSLISHPLQ